MFTGYAEDPHLVDKILYIQLVRQTPVLLLFHTELQLFQHTQDIFSFSLCVLPKLLYLLEILDHVSVIYV